MNAPHTPGQTGRDSSRRPSRLVSHSLPALVLTTALVALGLLGCSPPAKSGGSEDDNFELIRAKVGLVRFDSRTGQVWGTALNGDGGWEAIGAAPDLLATPARPGRFQVMGISQRANTRYIGGEPAIMVRLDADSGRTWLLESQDSTEWTLVREREGTGAPTAMPMPTPTSASPAASPAASTPQAAGAPTDDGTGTADDFPILTGDDLGATPEDRQKTLETLHNALAKEGMPQKMRVWAVRQLGELDPDMSVPELLVVLDDSDGLVVAEAVQQLGKIGKASTLPRIVSMRNHPDERVRAAVAEVVVAK